MSVTSALVLYVVIWFMVMFVVLPVRLRTQGDENDTVAGTHEGAPANFRFWRTILVVTLIGTAVWAVIAGVIISGLISVRDLDWFQRMSTPDLSR